MSGQAAATLTGRIKTIIRDKRFGFIERDSGGGDVFFHMSSLRVDTKQFHQLVEGDRVEFILVPSDKGPRAGDMRVV